MNDQEQKDFDYFTTQLSRLAAAAQVRPTAALAGAGILQLQTFAAEKFKGMIDTYAAMAGKQIAAQGKQMETLGPKMWEELHKRALIPVGDSQTEMKWFLNQWVSQMSCGECKGFLIKYIQNVPIDFGNYFGWSVDFHNAVNAKLGKKQFSALQARLRWRV